MSAYSGEKQKYVGIAVCSSASADTSYGVGLADVHRVTVHCGLKNGPITAVTTAYPYATAASTVAFSVRVGKYADPATAALGGATLELGSTAAGVCNNWDVIQIGLMATAATVLAGAHGKELTLMGRKYTISTSAASTLASTVLPISATNINAFGTALDTAVGRDFPQLAISVGASSCSFTSRYIRYKNVGEGKITASVTAQAGLSATTAGATTQPFIMGLEQHGAISFQPSHVVATNSSYTSFVVRALGGSTLTQHRSALAVIEPKRSGLVSKRVKLGPAT